jgi:hypothetical protein
LSFDANFWTAAAAVGQLFAAAAAIAGLFFLGAQVRAGRRVADVQILQEFARETTAREYALVQAEGDAQKQRAFVEYLNFLEIYAGAMNGKLLPSMSRKLIGDSLSNARATIQTNATWSDQFAAAIRTTSTFDEVGRFLSENRKAVSEKADLFRKQFSAPAKAERA